MATFFNTAIVILLANANFGHGIPVISWLFNGSFNDYSYDWYGNVGNQIVISMVINAVCPILEHIVEMTIFWFEVRSDQKWTWNSEEARYVTKCTNIM